MTKEQILKFKNIPNWHNVATADLQMISAWMLEVGAKSKIAKAIVDNWGIPSQSQRNTLYSQFQNNHAVARKLQAMFNPASAGSNFSLGVGSNLSKPSNGLPNLQPAQPLKDVPDDIFIDLNEELGWDLCRNTQRDQILERTQRIKKQWLKSMYEYFREYNITDKQTQRQQLQMLIWGMGMLSYRGKFDVKNGGYFTTDMIVSKLRTLSRTKVEYNTSQP